MQCENGTRGHDGDTGQLLLGHEGVGDALHAVHGADEGDGRAAAHHQAQGAGVLTSHFHNRLCGLGSETMGEQYLA